MGKGCRRLIKEFDVQAVPLTGMSGRMQHELGGSRHRAADAGRRADARPVGGWPEWHAPIDVLLDSSVEDGCDAAVSLKVDNSSVEHLHFVAFQVFGRVHLDLFPNAGQARIVALLTECMDVSTDGFNVRVCIDGVGCLAHGTLVGGIVAAS